VLGNHPLVQLLLESEEPVPFFLILERLAALPPLDLAYSEETEARLSGIVGGLSLNVVPQLLQTSLGSALC